MLSRKRPERPQIIFFVSFMSFMGDDRNVSNQLLVHRSPRPPRLPACLAPAVFYGDAPFSLCRCPLPAFGRPWRQEIPVVAEGWLFGAVPPVPLCLWLPSAFLLHRGVPKRPRGFKPRDDISAQSPANVTFNTRQLVDFSRQGKRDGDT